MNQDTTHLAKLLSEKKELLRLFVIAALLAFSVGTLGSVFAAQTVIPARGTAAIAILLILISFSLLAQDLRSHLHIEDNIQGVLFIDPGRNEIIPVMDYKFSEVLCDTLSAVKAESRSFFSEWDEEPLVPASTNQDFSESIGATGHQKPTYTAIYRVVSDGEIIKLPKAVRLLEEAVFFVLLETLSTHLSTYFNDHDGDMYLREYRREDMPYSLLKNRVINLLSTPIEHRDIFLDTFPQGAKRPEGELHALYGSDGSMYSIFDFILPKGSAIRYSEVDGIRIETKRLSIDLAVKYSGFGAAVDNAFLSHYVGRSPKSVECRMIAIGLKYRIKPLSLISSSGWQYYRWLDSFRKELRSSFDFGAFQDDIQWQVIKPLLFSMRSRRKLKTPPKHTSIDNT